MRRRLALGLALGALAVISLLAGPARAAPDTLRAGDPELAGITLPVGAERMRGFKSVGDEVTPLNDHERTITRAEEGGVAVYRIETRHVSDGDTTTGTLIVRCSDLSLVRQRVKAEGDSMAVTAGAGHVTGWVVLPGEPVRLLDVAIERPVLPVAGQIPWLIGHLPLAEGYAAVILRFSPWAGGTVRSELTVLGAEKIDWKGSSVACWKVDVGPMGPPGYRGAHWIERGTGRVLRSELSGPGDGPVYWATAE